jgi:hypothetical protein
MRSEHTGTHTSTPEVTNISKHGLWLFLNEREVFLSFQQFPWFANATIAQISKVERPLPHHLYWPELDVDLHVDSIERPEAYPLVSSASCYPAARQYEHFLHYYKNHRVGENSMPRTETVIKVFLASPMDLNSEREIVADVAASLSAIWTKTQNLRLELLRWETDTAPDAGVDPQAVVNRQLGDDYDIFLGLFWKTIGTPTRSSRSGSIEKFTRAHERFTQHGAPRIMIYFKNSPPASLDEIDTDQITALRIFREDLRKLGVLYRSFQDGKQFEEMLRLNLSQAVEDVRRSTRVLREGPPETLDGNELVTLDEKNDEGFLDLVLKGTEDFERVSEASKSITSRLGHFTERMIASTHALKELGPLTSPIAVRNAKRIVDGSADDLDTFASEIEAFTPIFSTIYTRAIDSYSGAAVLLRDFGAGDKRQLAEATQGMSNLKINLTSMMTVVKNFREIVEKWPRASTRLNRAKRRATAALDEYHTAAMIAYKLTNEADAMFLRLLEQREDDSTTP